MLTEAGGGKTITMDKKTVETVSTGFEKTGSAGKRSIPALNEKTVDRSQLKRRTPATGDVGKGDVRGKKQWA